MDVAPIAKSPFDFMQFLGLCSNSGAIYEGASSSSGTRVLPAPILTPIRFGGVAAIEPVRRDGWGNADVVFREYDFDAVTRIRRGRVHTSRLNSQPWEWHVHDPFRQDLPSINYAHGRAQVVSLITYQRDMLQELRSSTDRARLPRVVLGVEPDVTFWKIISVESDVSGKPVLTLKALFSMGELPEIIEDNVPGEARKALRVAVDRVEESVNRLGPIEVIDRCRDALSVVFGAKCGDVGKDLSAAVNAYVNANAEKRDDLRSWAGRMVARLHSRGKPNEQHAKGLRTPSEEDAQLALRCLWLVLVEFGWAN